MAAQAMLDGFLYMKKSSQTLSSARYLESSTALLVNA
eukprot:CAMPEP_0181135160 /NCGR_PEP_ID=MMETSP1071-20121207/32474_1 /TAXON_ID=35127 /ORGANISM="Thalassiosira sp., Strain NH16" /LENGTH=36 /DNA_ID= /DNA_START= /DNA_END= /DNA_ORIENTATION=